MKRLFSAILTLGVLFSSCCGTAFAAGTPDTRASFTLMGYSAELYADSNKGEVYVSYSVQASKFADSVGIRKIVFYESDGDYVTTIFGSTRNGLIASQTNGNVGDYEHILTSGVYYYAEVTVFATASGVTDSRIVRTSTVKAP